MEESDAGATECCRARAGFLEAESSTTGIPEGEGITAAGCVGCGSTVGTDGEGGVIAAGVVNEDGTAAGGSDGVNRLVETVQIKRCCIACRGVGVEIDSDDFACTMRDHLRSTQLQDSVVDGELSFVKVGCCPREIQGAAAILI